MPKQKAYSSSSSNTIQYLAIGGAIYAGALLAYVNIQNSQRKLSDQHRVQQGTVNPPPTIRTPQGGNGLYGYFDSWFYQGQPNNHAQEL